MPRIAAFVVAIVLVGWLAASRPQPVISPSERASAVAASLMSPYCPGMTLATCPSAAAGELRAEIQTRIAGGESESSIVASLATRFGMDLSGAPRARGVALLLWLVPAVAGVAMIAILFRAGRHGPAGPEPDTDGASDAALAERLDDELHQLG